MRFLIAALALLLTPHAMAQETRWPSAEANQYWPLKQARIDAYRIHDRGFFEALLTDNFVTLGAGGQTLTREQYLAAEFGENRAEGVSTETEVTDFTARRTGSTLVLAYNEVERTAVGNDAFVEHLGRLDVYVRQRGRWRLQTMTAVRIPQAPATIQMSAEQLAHYVGSYVFAPNAVSVVTLVGGKLMEQTTGQDQTELLPVGPDVFYQPPNVEARVAFERDASGRVSAQIYRHGDQSLLAPRADD